MYAKFTMLSGHQRAYLAHEICVIGMDYQAVFGCRMDEFKQLPEEYIEFCQQADIFQAEINKRGIYQLNVIYGDYASDYYKEKRFNAYVPKLMVSKQPGDKLTPPVVIPIGKHSTLPEDFIYSDCLLNSFLDYDLFIKNKDSAFDRMAMHRQPNFLEQQLKQKKIKAVALHGGQIDACIPCTARDALITCGFDMLIIADQTCGQRKVLDESQQIERNKSEYSYYKYNPTKGSCGLITKEHFLNTLANC